MVVTAVFIAGYVTFFKKSRGGLELTADHGETASVTDVAVPEEMKALTDLYRTINLVQKRYIDASRINPKEMFVGALKAIQLNVARVMVNEAEEYLTVRVSDIEKQFDLSELKTPWILLQRVKEVFTFIKREAALEPDRLNDIEYAAINGMLKTLDPHSVFLNPDQYREMKDKTHGNFAGLGIVISIRDGVLTIISPMDGTPADQAGLEAGDQIVKIDDESTVNMALNDAVDLLRGDPGTKVTVHIMRKGWVNPKPYTVVRAIVKVESLETHLLPGKVGYLRIKDFQGNTAEDIQSSLQKWGSNRIQGLVLDLRGCPGGLLEAAVQVSDLFLKQGVIVTTAGQGPGDRDIRHATDSGDEPSYPVVVIVDQGSASASEILAGALKNHNRALVIGEQTFGKGSVQVLFEFHESHLPNETTALKLTTAQYLTPGDISIQSVGVVPHIGVLPMRADKEVIDLKIDGGYREADLTHHFEVARQNTEADKPVDTISYLWTPPISDKKDEEEDEPLPEADKPFEPDFMINFGRDIVAKLAPKQVRIDENVFKSLSGVLAEKRRDQEKQLVSALKKLDINWQPATGTGATTAVVDMDLNGDEIIEAGGDAKLTVTVTNNGPDAFHRLSATTQSDFRPFDDRELAFGLVKPGETVSRNLTFPVPKDALAEVNDILFTFSADKSNAPAPTALRFTVSPSKRPQFAYRLKIDDTLKGNGDGTIQRGESVTLEVEIKNIGEGKSLNTYATIKSLSGKSLFLIRGRENLQEMAPEETKTAKFAFEVKSDFAEPEARFEMAVADVDLREYLVNKLELPVAKDEKTHVPSPQSELNASPRLSIENLSHVTTSEEIVIKGEAEDETMVRDVYIFVDDQKHFFKSGTEKTDGRTLRFETSLPLNNGINYITVVAEETSELETRKLIAVRRDRPDNMPFLLSRNSTKTVKPLGVIPLNGLAFSKEGPSVPSVSKLDAPPKASN